MAKKETDGKIHLPGKKVVRLTERPVIRVSSEAYDCLAEITNETNLTIARVASEIIIQGCDLVVFDREEN